MENQRTGTSLLSQKGQRKGRGSKKDARKKG